MADGPMITERPRVFTIETTNGMAKNLMAGYGAAQGGVVLGTAATFPVGASLEAVLSTNGKIPLQTSGVAKVVAAGAITIAANVPSRVVMAANGKVQALPATAGTYYQAGWLDPSADPPNGDGDITSVLLDFAKIVVDANGDVVSETAAQDFIWNASIVTAVSLAGVNVAGFVVPTGKTLAVSGVSVFARTVAAAITVDVMAADTTILDAAITPVADTVTAGVIADASVAATQEVNVILTTDGSGAATNLQVTIVGQLVP